MLKNFKADKTFNLVDYAQHATLDDAGCYILEYADAIYIGQTVCLKDRLNAHKNKNKRSKLMKEYKDKPCTVYFMPVVESELVSVETQLIADARDAGYKLLNSAKEVSNLCYADLSVVFTLEDGKLFKQGKAVKVNPTNYSSVSFNGKSYAYHRVVYCLYTQRDLNSDIQIDHIDHNKTNNLPSNLQALTLANNIRRQRKNHVKKGFIVERGGKFILLMPFLGKTHSFGSFVTRDEAEKKSDLLGECWPKAGSLLELKEMLK